MSSENALHIAEEIISGTPVYEMPAKYLHDPEPPTPLALIDQVEGILHDGLNVEHAKIEDELAQLEFQLQKAENAALLEKRARLTASRGQLFRGLDLMVSTPQVVKRSDEPTLSFYGWSVADVSSQRGKAQRWVELRLYRTLEGRWVCEELRVSKKKGETDIPRVDVVDTDRDVVGFFGDGQLSQDIYMQAGIVTVEPL